MFSAKQLRHFCQVAQDRGVSCFSFLFAMFMLIWLRYTKVQHNNHKTIFQNIFFAKLLYSLLLAFCNKVRNSALLFLISTFFGMLPVFPCQIGLLKLTNYYFIIACRNRLY